MSNTGSPRFHPGEGVDEDLAREAFALAAAKLPIQTAFVKRVIL